MKITATEFWEKKFGEKPQTDVEKLAVAMMAEYGDYLSHPLENFVSKPTIVCLCGSTKFKDAFDEANYQENGGQDGELFIIDDGKLKNIRELPKEKYEPLLAKLHKIYIAYIALNSSRFSG